LRSPAPSVEGARVVLCARDERLLSAAAAALNRDGAQVETAVSDLSRDDERQRLAAAHSDVDILVNNAGAIPGGDLFAVSMAVWKDAWALKVMGYIHMTQLYLARMRERRDGVILNIIGMAGQAPRFDYICGSAGNAALMAFTQAVGAKAPEWNVRVLGINPSATRTERIVSVSKERAKSALGDETRWAELLTGLPFGRLAEPTEIGALAAMLASPKASYLSGTVIDADGGQQHRSD
jgi:NAD(P)-dependent dehydrogenase (short-subunit alcohol dehydrogenase family)